MNQSENRGTLFPVLSEATRRCPEDLVESQTANRVAGGMQVALLTGGGDKPYALGLASALMDQKIRTDFVGSDEVDSPDLHKSEYIRFLNLRGDQSPCMSLIKKATRLLIYYWRLFVYATNADPVIFHILWHNKFEFFDRIVLMGFYKALGKKIVFTAHNINAGQRDGNDSWSNRLSLKCQYHYADKVFVHTELMKKELAGDFSVPESRISVIPFGINNTLSRTGLTGAEARSKLGIPSKDKTVLFFGNIAPYKGLEYLVRAMAAVIAKDPDCRLVIAGRPKGCEEYWRAIQDEIFRLGIDDNVLTCIKYIPDDGVEIYFKAADVLVLPYLQIFQSGVLFLGYSFGLPVIASDVGSMRDDIIPGETGFVCKPMDAGDLGRVIEKYFKSGMFAQLGSRREAIREFANKQYSWDTVGHITAKVYEELMGAPKNKV